jgi:hypothetical protein
LTSLSQLNGIFRLTQLTRLVNQSHICVFVVALTRAIFVVVENKQSFDRIARSTFATNDISVANAW